MKEEKYYTTDSKTLADALGYLGFKYYKFDNEKYGKVYSFNNTKEFQDARDYLWALKCKFNPIKKNVEELKNK